MLWAKGQLLVYKTDLIKHYRVNRRHITCLKLKGHIQKYPDISLLTKFRIYLVNMLQKLIYSGHVV